MFSGQLQGSDRGDLCVLLIEENRVEVLNLVRAFNNVVTCPIHTAESPAQAMEMLRTTHWSTENPRPNVIVIALPLAKQGTFHFLRIIRNDEHLSAIDIFVLSCSENERDLSEAYKYHIQGYIIRPQAQEPLQQVLRQLSQYWSMTRRPRLLHALDKVDDTTRSQRI